MKGAIIGDIIGSVYEFDNIKTKDFPLFSTDSGFTDDSVMTCAVGTALLGWRRNPSLNLQWELIRTLKEFGRHYPFAGYGARFSDWLWSEDPFPYGSWGNGAAMRCSAAGWLAASAEEARELGEKTASVTHNHPDALKAAGLTAELIFRARKGASLTELKTIAEAEYEIPSMDALRPGYEFDVSCAGTMPAALAALFESSSFEDAIRNAVSLGGDSDTIAAITGSVAEPLWGIPEELWERACDYLTQDLQEAAESVEAAAEQV